MAERHTAFSIRDPRDQRPAAAAGVTRPAQDGAFRVATPQRGERRTPAASPRPSAASPIAISNSRRGHTFSPVDTMPSNTPVRNPSTTQWTYLSGIARSSPASRYGHRASFSSAVDGTPSVDYATRELSSSCPEGEDIDLRALHRNNTNIIHVGRSIDFTIEQGRCPGEVKSDVFLASKVSPPPKFNRPEFVVADATHAEVSGLTRLVAKKSPPPKVRFCGPDVMRGRALQPSDGTAFASVSERL